MAIITLCKTKAGAGFKLIANGIWHYTSSVEFFKMIKGDANACTFRTIAGDKSGN